MQALNAVLGLLWPLEWVDCGDSIRSSSCVSSLAVLTILSDPTAAVVLILIHLVRAHLSPCTPVFYPEPPSKTQLRLQALTAGHMMTRPALVRAGKLRKLQPDGLQRMAAL